MNTFETIVAAVALLGFITYRQTRWVPVKLGQLLRMPVIFVLAGLLQIPSAAQQLPASWHLHRLDVLLISTELAMALVVGWAMGRLTETSTIDGALSARLGASGVAVWIGFIAVRVGLAVVAAGLHAPLAALPAVIFFVVAAIKITQTVVLRRRLAGHRVEQSQPHHSLKAAQWSASGQRS